MEDDTFHQSTNGIGRSAEAMDMSLLVVDDDRVFCDRLGRALASRGFTARTAMSVAEAMEVIKTAPPAFAVIDLRLGDGSGLEVIRALKDEARRCAWRDPDRLWRDRQRGDGGQDRRIRLPRQTDKRRRRGRRSDGRTARHSGNQKSRSCRRPGSGGSTSSAFSRPRSATYPRRRGNSTCTDGPFNAYSPSTPRNNSLNRTGDAVLWSLPSLRPSGAILGATQHWQGMPRVRLN